MPLPLIRIIDNHTDELEAAYLAAADLAVELEAPPSHALWDDVLKALQAWHAAALVLFDAFDTGLVHLIAENTSIHIDLVLADRIDNCEGELECIADHFETILNIAFERCPTWEPRMPTRTAYATIQRFLTLHREEFAEVHCKRFRGLGLPIAGFAELVGGES